jgi:hypothetical protein
MGYFRLSLGILWVSGKTHAFSRGFPSLPFPSEPDDTCRLLRSGGEQEVTDGGKELALSKKCVNSRAPVVQLRIGNDPVRCGIWFPGKS